MDSPFHMSFIFIAIGSWMACTLHASVAEDLGLSDYHHLINEAYDFSVIDRANIFLQTVTKASVRPSHCPLNQTTGQDLLEKLELLHSGLENSACKEYKDSYLANFSSTISKLGVTYATMPTNMDPANSALASLTQQTHYRTINEMVGSLSGLVSDVRCAFDIKERGLIPVVSDILGSASVSALFAPSKYAFVAGVSGLAITSSLKIISSLLASHYDMTKAKDRENFVKLACSFYDLRRDLEKNNFLRVPSTRDTLNHILVTSYIESLTSKKTWLVLKKFESMNILKASRSAFVAAQLGEEKFTFHRDLPTMKAKLLPPPEGDDTAHSLSYRLNLVTALQDIAKRFKLLHFDNDRYRIFSNIETDRAVFTNFRETLFASDTQGKSDHDLAKTFVEAFHHVELILNEEVAAAERAWLAHEVDEAKTYGAIIVDVNKVFDTQIERFTTTLAKLREKEIEIAKIIARKNFASDDEGTHIDHAIVEEIIAIQKSIYGHYGWRFFEYVRDRATNELAAFNNNFRKFHRTYFAATHRAQIVSEPIRQRACATARNLLLSINNSRSLVNMATDFIFTNRDFFHDNVVRIDIHFYVIPTGRSIERQLLTEARSLIEAQQELASTRMLNFPTIILEKPRIKKPHLRDLMLAQTYVERLVLPLYNFQVAYECAR